MTGAGFWVARFDGSAPQFVDAHPEHGSAVASAYPKVDGIDAYSMERAVDWILNAAGAGRERVARAFRAVYPGSRVERMALPSEWWDAQMNPWAERGHVLAIDFSTYFGTDATSSADRSRAGLVVDDSDDGDTVTGFSGGPTVSGTTVNQAQQRSGQGPGRGPSDRANAGHGTWGTQQSNQGAVEYGSLPTVTGDPNAALHTRAWRAEGQAVPAEAALRALQTGTFTNWNLGMGGGGGGSSSADGLDGGDGLVRISQLDITESTNRDLQGESSASTNRLGSGGGYYAISRRGYTLANGTNVDLGNGSSVTAYNNSGQGRFTTFTVDQPTISGTITHGIATHFQVYPAVPIGGLRVSG